jgi:hypothetical protein
VDGFTHFRWTLTIGLNLEAQETPAFGSILGLEEILISDIALSRAIKEIGGATLRT